MQLLGLTCAFGSLIAATPIANLPINAQVPPVARADTLFSFTFSQSTFTSTRSSLTYALSDSPKWLVLDGNARTLSGTPREGDSGSLVAKIVASDDEGSTQMPFTIVVSEEIGPSLGRDVSIQLPAFGAFSSPNSILFPPSAPFSISFSNDTFTETNQGTVYYATTSDHTPLPSWIQFDHSNLAFSGRTPTLPSSLNGAQTYGIQLTASNVIGFSTASTSFNIVVGDHILAFRSSTLVLNITAGSPVRDAIVANNLAVNGHNASTSDVRLVSANIPSWLRLDPLSLEISGLAPLNFAGQNFSVTVASSTSNTATAVVVLQTTRLPELALLNPIGMTNATIGSDFVYQLAQTINESNAKVTVDLGIASAWLRFDAQQKLIKGHVPKDVRPQQIIVNITASLENQTQSELLTIAVQSFSSTVGTQTSGSGTSNPTAQSIFGKTSFSHLEKRFIPAIIVPCAVLIALCVVGFLVWKRRQKRRTPKSFSDDSSELPKRAISRPLGPQRLADVACAVFNEKKDGPKVPSRFSLPPQLPLLPSLLSTQRLSRDIRSRDHRKERAEPSHSWRLSTSFLNISRPYSKACSDFHPIPEETPTQRLDDNGKAVSIVKPPTKTFPSKAFSKRKESVLPDYSGLGSNSKQLMKGLGHGKPGTSEGYPSISVITRGSRHALGPPGFGEVRPSWRDCDQSQGSSDWATTSDISSNKDNQRKIRSTIRPVWHSNHFHSGSSSSWVQYGSQVRIPKSAKRRQLENPFMSAGSIHGRKGTRRTRSRSSSLDPPLRPLSTAQSSYPRALKVREGACRTFTRDSFSSNDLRFESAVQSELASMCEHAYADDLDEEDVRPGLPVATHRQHNVWADLTHRIKRLEPAFDDKSSVFGGEGSTLGSRDDGTVNVKLLSRGQRLAHQMGLRPTDPANRSMRGRIEQSDTFSTAKGGSKRSGSMCFV